MVVSLKLDPTQKAQQIAERVARNMVGGRLTQVSYEDKDVGPIYVALGRGDYRDNRGVVHINVWRGVWFFMFMGIAGRGEPVEWLDGRLTEEEALSHVIQRARIIAQGLKEIPLGSGI